MELQHPMQNRTMSLDTKLDSKVIYMDCNGIEHDRLFYKSTGLIPEGEYTVDRLEIGRTCSYVWLKEFPGIKFNTVCFYNKGVSIDERFDVLDKGFVRLVDRMGDDLSIVRAARVSYNADWRSGEDTGSDSKLIRYLMKNKHTSPFEAVVFTFEIKAPIFIFRQWHRHRMWSYNEVSARYTELDEGFYIPKPEHVGQQSRDNKQVRDLISFDSMSQEEMALAANNVSVIEAHSQICFDTYKHLLKNGVPREIARSVLSVNAYSRMFATVDLHNLFHFLRLRLHPHAQFEIREYAEAMLGLIEPYVPVAVAAFKETLEREKNLEECLKEVEQALREVQHAQAVGANWYTNGEDGLYKQVLMWVQRGFKALEKVKG